MGDVTLILENKCHLKSKDCFYALEFRNNFILVSSLNSCNYLVYFNKKMFIRKNNSFICSSPLVDNLYHITLSYISPNVKYNQNSFKRKVLNTNQIFVRHLHISHINLNRI